jgi:multidrug resistance efflux pump
MISMSVNGDVNKVEVCDTANVCASQSIARIDPSTIDLQVTMHAPAQDNKIHAIVRVYRDNIAAPIERQFDAKSPKGECGCPAPLRLRVTADDIALTN